MCFFRTKNDYSTMMLRIGAGAAMLPFGLMKLGVLPGGGISGTIQFMGGMGIPSFIAVLVIAGESLGALSLILGFCTRFCAASLAVIMAGAVYILSGNGYLAPMGYATPLAFLLMFLPLVVSGGGAWSVDGMIAKKRG